MFVDYDLDFVLLYCFGHSVMLFCTGCYIQCWFRERGRRGQEIQRVSKEHDAFQKTSCIFDPRYFNIHRNMS